MSGANDQANCPACEGRIEQVVATCRPGEHDVTTRCLGCGRVRHAVFDNDGEPFSAEALQAHRKPPPKDPSSPPGA